MAGKWKEFCKDIDDRTYQLVHGYIREYENTFKHNHSSFIIPSLVIYTCLMYYWMNEYFDVINKHFISRSDNKMVIKRFAGNKGWDNSNFCKKRVHSTSNNIYKWTLKIISKKHDANVLLGITGNERTDKLFIWDQKARFYGYYNSTFLLNPYKDGFAKHVPFSGGDTLCVNLNLSKSQISFEVKDSYNKVDTEDIDCRKDLEYRFAVSIMSPDTSVELLDFEVEELDLD